MKFIISENRDDLIPQLRIIAGKEWSLYYEQFLIKLESENKTSLLVNAMVMNDEKGRLIKALEHYEGVELILQVAPYLNKIDHSFLKERLGQSIEIHLNTHVGYQSADFILDIFMKLSSQRLDNIIEHLFRLVIKKFPERKHLIKYIKEAAI
ncbi:MAG: hypothetical protein IPL46_23110 [Saprospiraceae bacterium]|nr:hypothetical protein [Saprospiraceae bacterium]